MTGISRTLPEDLSNSLADPAKTSGQTASYLAMDVICDSIQHEKKLMTQIELTSKEADQGKFAADEFSDMIFSSAAKLAQLPSLGRNGWDKQTREQAVPNWSYLIPYGIRSD